MRCVSGPSGLPGGLNSDSDTGALLCGRKLGGNRSARRSAIVQWLNTITSLKQ